ncbi:NlpC/P60 family protein [Clostridium perfringens]|nr:NlpC/P60 family protein [Clostridium perfringens]MDK0850254.1 NlpC/P60 family protein [Clostridium perfringens]MDM0743565.1 NlpC/P60 family protein [Clostridium perfringens]MDM0775480.1 NlpC/P60 family protein [Clostridium perfringens]
MKNNLKDKASGGVNSNNNSNIIKDIAKAKILAIVAPFLGWLILIVIIIIIMLAPLSYAHMLMMKTFDDIQNGILKTGTNISNAMSDWFKSDDEAIKDSGEKYENYLTKRFMQLNKQMYNKDYHDINDKKDVAVNWVYGKIYKSYFDSSFMENFISELTPWKDAENTTYEFKDVSYSASNIYSPSKSLDVATARRLTFGDETNVYDIMAFDYVAGSLFDMLELDIVQLRNDVTQEKTNEVGEILGDKLKEAYIGSSVELLNMLDKYSKESISKKINPTLSHLGIKSELSGGENFYNLLKIVDSKISNKNKYGVYKDDIALILKFGGNGNKELATEYIELYSERGKIGTENYKYNEALKKEIEAGKKNDKNFKTDKKEKTEYLSYANKRQDELQEMAMEHISDLSKVLEYVLETYQNLKISEYSKVNKDTNWTTLDKKKIEFLKNNDIKIFNLTDSLKDILDKGYKKAYNKKDNLLGNTINTELENRISKQVGELKLVRTQEAANSYKNYLTQTEVTNRIVYKVLDDSKIKELKEFKTLNKYKGVNITFNDNSPSVKLITDGNYTTDIDSSIKKKTFLDANKKPIVSGIDSSSGVEYFQGYLSEYIGAVKSSLVSAEENIESLSFYSNGVVNKDKILKSIKDESIKETLTKDDFVKIAKDLESKLDEKRKILSNVRVKLNELENGSLSSSLLSDANISTVYPAGQAGRKTDKYFLEGNNTLLIRKYNYTLEEAVKAVAQQHYGDILSKFGREDGTVGTGAAINIGDLQLGTWLDPSHPRHSSYVAASEYIDIAKQVVAENGDCIDPHLIIAMIAVESSGNMSSDNGYAVGLTQIEHVYWGKTITLPNGQTRKVDPALIKVDAKLAIELGMWQIFERMKEFHGNLLVSIGGYNFGTWGVRRVILHHLDSLGVAKLSDWTTPRFLPSSVSKPINDYIKSMDTGWLASREWYVNGGHKFFPGAGGGTLDHIEKVLGAYNTAEGTPWYRNPETGEKISVISGDTSVIPDENEDVEDESGEPKKIYHKNKELVLWKEYYTDNKTFELADKWSKKVNKDSLGDDVDISKLFIDSIVEESKSKEGAITGNGLTIQKYENILAGAINRDNKFKLPIKGVVGEQAKQEVYKYVSNISKEITDSLNLLSAKNYKFGLYRYSSTNKDIVDSELSNDYASFEEFLMEKRKNEGSSTMWLPIEAIEVAKILSGDIRVDAVDFYGALNNESNTSNKPAPVERFYKEWINAKAILHEVFNMMTDDDRYENGERIHDELTIPNADGNNSNDTAKNPDLIGVLKLENKSGEPKEVSVNIIKKHLENNVDRNLKRKDSDIKYIVIHDTNLSKDSVYSHYNKKSDGSKSTMNYFVDSTEVTQFIEDEYPSNHLFDKKDATSSVVSNWNSIGIEMSGGNTSTFWNTVALTKYLMEKYSIPVENIVMHKDVTNADCSKYMQKETLKENMSNWDVFIDALKSKDITVEFESGDTATGTAAEIIEYAKTFIGLPYVWAGSGEIITRELIANFQRQWGPGQRYIVPDRFFDGKSRAFDCSGFTQYVYNHFGYSIGRTTENQKDTGRGVDLKDISPGDLIILGPPNGPTTHVVMYIGNDEIIHAPQTGEFIRTESYSEYIKRNGNRVRTVRRYLD